MTTIYKGDDIEILDAVKDENGNKIALNALSSIAVEVKHSKTGEVLKSGTYAGGEVKIASTSLSQIGFYIDDELTSEARIGSYDYVITVGEANLNFTDGIKTTTSITKYIFQLNEK